MLHGEPLLARLKQLQGLSRSELVRACGYSTRGSDGRERLHFSEFYAAVLDAKGVQLPGVRDRSRARARGRQLSFNTHVHFNGNLMVGRAYTEKLRLQPGDQFRIQLADDEIRLIPLERHALS